MLMLMFGNEESFSWCCFCRSLRWWTTVSLFTWLSYSCSFIGTCCHVTLFLFPPPPPPPHSHLHLHFSPCTFRITWSLGQKFWSVEGHRASTQIPQEREETLYVSVHSKHEQPCQNLLSTSLLVHEHATSAATAAATSAAAAAAAAAAATSAAGHHCCCFHHQHHQRSATNLSCFAT